MQILDVEEEWQLIYPTQLLDNNQVLQLRSISLAYEVYKEINLIKFFKEELGNQNYKYSGFKVLLELRQLILKASAKFPVF